MNVIVSNKQKNILDNANIDAIKELNGFFRVDDLINNFKNYFFTKMIVDATSIYEFANPEVLKKLVSGICAEKLLVLLPQRPEPPKSFLDLLISLGIYNFSSNINDIIKFLQTPNTYEDVQNNSDDFFDYKFNDEKGNNSININNDGLQKSLENDNPINSLVNNINEYKKVSNKYILGIKNVTVHAGTTSLIYMIKQTLEYRFNKKVIALEFNTNDFGYFKTSNMISTDINNFESVLKDNDYDIMLIDLNNNNFETLCNDVLYLIEPSIISVNKLISHNRMIFNDLKDKKVVLNKCLLSNEDIKIFSKEAGIPFYFAIPPLNDRVGNSIIESLINKLNAIIE